MALNYERINEIDIVPVQMNRVDPRQRVSDKVERKVRSMGVRRNRISKRKVDRYMKQKNVRFDQQMANLAASLGIIL